MDHICTQSHLSSYEPAEEKLDKGRKQAGKARREMEGLRGKLGISGLRETVPVNQHGLPTSEFHVKTTFLSPTQMESREH